MKKEKKYKDKVKKIGVQNMKEKKKMTPEEKANMEIKYEIAEELGLLEKVEQVGWKGLTSEESGKIGGIMGKRKRQERQNQKNKNHEKE